MEEYKLYRLIRYGCAPMYIYAKSISQIPLMIGESIFRKFDLVMRVIPPYNVTRPDDGEFFKYDDCKKTFV